MEYKEFSSQELFVQACIDYIKAICIPRGGVKHIALAGGQTPKPVYEALSQERDLVFSQIHFWQVDERYVPSDEAYSNQKMIREVLVHPLGERLGAFHFFDTSIAIESSVEKYQKEFEKVDQIDICILGIGSDGHTASLMVGQASVHNVDDSVLIAHNPFHPDPPIEKRLTLGWKALMNAKHVLLVASGKSKKQVIHDLLHGSYQVAEFPAKKLLEHPNLHIYFQTEP